jgi:hypothetical protein
MNRPIIKIFLLPCGKGWGERKLRQVHKDIVSAMAAIPELSIKTQNDFYTLFPTDLMKLGLGEEIVVESRVPVRMKSENLRKQIENGLMAALMKHLPDARYEFATDMPPFVQQ